MTWFWFYGSLYTNRTVNAKEINDAYNNQCAELGCLVNYNKDYDCNNHRYNKLREKLGK